MDYAKSVLPSQLIAERGADVIVINPGSSNLRVGMASWQTPIVVPHLIARHITPTSLCPLREKGVVGEHLFRNDVTTTKREIERDDAFQMVESLLTARQLVRKHGHIGEPTKSNTIKKKDLKWALDDKTSLFAFTKVKANEDLMSLASIEDTNQGVHESDNDGNNIQQFTFREYICGDQALRIPANEPYILRRPICRGRINVSEQYSMQQVCDDLHAIWDWVLTEKLSLPKESRKTLSALLVVPDTLDNREVKEILSVVLKDLQFRSAVVHQECVAATFGNGIPSACVVNLGAQITSITCIEDGVAIPNSRLVYPFGGEDIARCFLWVQHKHKAWPVHDTDPLHDPLDMLLLTHLKEDLCVIADGEQKVMTNVYSCVPSQIVQVHRATLKALNVPPMGLFYPSLLAPEEYVPLARPWHCVDHEDVLDDVNHEAGKKPEIVDTGAPGGVNGSSTPGGNSQTSVSKSPMRTNYSTEDKDSIVGLSQAIVSSIFSTGRPDIQAKLFSSIQLVGGVASTKGLVDAIEERVLESLPPHETIERVEVLPNRVEPSLICWKGGVILCVLDFARDAWIQYEDWMEGGIRIGAARKYKDSNSIHAQSFWYSSVME